MTRLNSTTRLNRINACVTLHEPTTDTTGDFSDWFDSDSDYNSDVSDLIDDHTPNTQDSQDADDHEEKEDDDDEEERSCALDYLKSQRGVDYNPSAEPRAADLQETDVNVVGAKLDVPSTRAQVARHPEAKLIYKAEDRERDVLRRFDVWAWARLPRGKRALGSRFVYSRNSDPRKKPWKARFVGQGFRQVQFRDYFQTTSP